MSALYWARVIRKVRGLNKQPEYTSLEALVEAEADLPSDDFRIAAWVVGPMIAILGSAPCLYFGLTNNRFALWGALFACLIGGGLWFIFDRMDRAIPRS